MAKLSFLLFAGLFLQSFGQPVTDKVVVSFYAESLCPDCIQFTRGPLTEAFEKVSEIFTLNYVPWGNAKLLSGGRFECQHGEMECIMNTYDACVLHYYPLNSQFWPYLKCAVTYGESLDPKGGDTCAMNQNFDVEKIRTCRNGQLGHSLELGYYNQTAATQPRQHYTPWVTINGQHDEDAEGDMLVSVICKAYSGAQKPAACMD